ncbi:MAG: methylenetetrahydrofolate reductase [Candidatus Diapherotrites archaeon]|nr:methylenetetrahydrofolate reductase [Candidatus Diapherotrites archaeon]
MKKNNFQNHDLKEIQTFREKLENNQFALTIEIDPMKSPSFQFTNSALKACVLADAVNVVDCPMGNVIMNSLVPSIELVSLGFEPIMQITCRDRNSIAIQSDLLGAKAKGIDNFLLLTGDPPKLGDNPKAKAVFEMNSIELISKVNTMIENSADFAGNPLENKFDAFIGGGSFATAKNPEIKRIRQKALFGAQFIQTQPFFDLTLLEEFFKATKDINTKILPGILLLTSAKTAKFLNEHVPGITIPEEVISEIEDTQSNLKFSNEMLEKAKKLGFAGAHIMPFGNFKLAGNILERHHSLK